MKNKGFTLIELLAVIVILAIIAVIAIPRILNVVEESKRESAKSSALGYIDAVEKQIMMNDLKKDNLIQDGEYNDVVTFNTNSNIRVSGKLPSSGEITISKGKVTSANLCINGYNVNYNGSKAIVSTKCGEGNNGGSSTPTYVAYAVGDSINFDPTIGTSGETCSNPTIGTGDIGCMKWYVIKASGTSDSTVDVILDHNTTALIAYDTSGRNNTYENATIKNTVDALATTKGWKVTPRIITADEINSITGKTNFDASDTNSVYYFDDPNKGQTPTANGQGTSNYAWLYDYTIGCTSKGCNTADSSTYGYWTSTAVGTPGSGAYMWFVTQNGNLNYGHAEYGASYYGIRPVITIQKSALN